MKPRMFVVCLFLATTVVAKQEKSPLELLSAIAEREGIPLPPTEPVVGLPEGAETPEKALEDFTRAAAEGDVDAALTLIDPEVRPLIALEVSIDHVVMIQKVQSQIVEEMTESKPGFRMIGFSPLCAEREILKHRKFDVLEKRPIDANNVVLRITRVTGKFGGVGENRITDEALAVRRKGRWYLFYLLGYMNASFEGALLGDRHDDSNSEVPGVFSMQPDGAALPESSDYVKIFHIPIQRIHQEMVVAARHPAILQCGQIQRKAERNQRNLSNRLLRGDFENYNQWNVANETLDDCLEISANALVEVVEEANQRLVNQFSK